MLFEKLKNTKLHPLVLFIIFILLFTIFFGLITGYLKLASEASKSTFEYVIGIREKLEKIDRILEPAETNINVLADTIANSYDINRQNDKKYNFDYIKSTDALVKAVLTNSPNASGSWFQINADLPFSVDAYNWYEFKDNQFINLESQFSDSPSGNRRITPEDDPYYFGAVDNKGTTWSPVYTDPDTNIKMITVSTPIYVEDLLVGVVGTDIPIDNIQQELKNMQLFFENSELFLLDENNKVILSQLIPTSNASKHSYKFLNLFNDSENCYVEYYDNLTRKVAIKFGLPNNDKLVITFNSSNIYNSFNSLLTIIYILFLLLISLSIFAYVMKKKVQKIEEVITNQNLNADQDETESNDEREL